MKHVVLGAGPVGTALAELLQGEHHVDLFSVMGVPSYDRSGTEPVTVDGTDSGRLA